MVGIVGLAVMCVGGFLPLWDEASTGFVGLASNSLVQSGYGWLTLVLAAISAVSLYRIYERGARAYWPSVAGLLVIAQAIYIGMDEETMTVCALTETGVDSSACQVADPGLGVYAVGAGGALLLLAGAMIARLPVAAKHAATTG